MPGQANIQVIDLNGRLMHNEELKEGHSVLNTDQWAIGVYIAVFQFKNGATTSLKLIKE